MEDCIFCAISKNNIPTKKIYEDDKVLAFLDISPYCEGHTLLIPKSHYRWIWDMPDDLTSHFFKIAKKIGKHYQVITKDEFVKSMTLGLDVEHAHLHILPNSSASLNKSLGKKLSKERDKPTQEELNMTANRFKL